MKNGFIKITSTFALVASISFAACQKDAQMTPSVKMGKNTFSEPIATATNAETAFLAVENSNGGTDIFEYNAATQTAAYKFPILGVCDTIHPTKGCSLMLTGLAYDATTSEFYTTTNAKARKVENQNRLFVFNNLGNFTRSLPLIDATTRTAVTDLSDLERNPADGKFYAIRGNNRVVRVDKTTGQVQNLGTATLTNLCGLTIKDGKILVLQKLSGNAGRLIELDNATGNLLRHTGFSSISIGSAGLEMGIHAVKSASNVIMGDVNGFVFGTIVYFTNIQSAYQLYTSSQAPYQFYTSSQGPYQIRIIDFAGF